MTTDTTTNAPAKMGGTTDTGPDSSGHRGRNALLSDRTATNKVIVVTGLSGAGKTHALKSLEDLGYEAVDNLPLSLLGSLVRSGELTRPLAIGIDIRLHPGRNGPADGRGAHRHAHAVHRL